MASPVSLIPPRPLREAIQLHPCKDADAFLDSLLMRKSPLKEFVLKSGGKVIFRGVGDVQRHRLLPSLFREETLLAAIKAYCFRSFDWLDHTDLAAICCESEMLKGFAENCNAIGIQLPFDLARVNDACMAARFWSQTHLYELESQKVSAVVGASNLEWPTEDIISCMSLAQHFGLPTRLLDFTDSPQHAAYFAAEKWRENASKGAKFFAVTCLAPIWIPVFYPAPFAITHVRPVRAGNVHIAAQRGSFLYQRTHYRGSPFPVDQEFVERYCRLTPFEEKMAVFPVDYVGMKFTCPIDEAESVLQALAGEGIGRAEVYPSYQTIADEVAKPLWQMLLSEKDEELRKADDLLRSSGYHFAADRLKSWRVG